MLELLDSNRILLSQVFLLPRLLIIFVFYGITFSYFIRINYFHLLIIFYIGYKIMKAQVLESLFVLLFWNTWQFCWCVIFYTRHLRRNNLVIRHLKTNKTFQTSNRAKIDFLNSFFFYFQSLRMSASVTYFQILFQVKSESTENRCEWLLVHFAFPVLK